MSNNRIKKNKEIVKCMKRNSVCAYCGTSFANILKGEEDYEKIVFHHKAGLKVFDISNGYDKPTEELLAEIEKCELVCRWVHEFCGKHEPKPIMEFTLTGFSCPHISDKSKKA